MADWSLAGLGTNYDTLLNNLKDRDVDMAKMFDGTGSTNLPTGTVGWSSTNSRFEKWSGTAWGVLASTYNINVSTVGGKAASDFIWTTARGVANGVAELDANALLPTSRLPTGYGKGVANGIAGLDASGLLTTDLLPVGYGKGAANGIAELDASSKLPVSRLPAGYTKDSASGIAGLDASSRIAVSALPSGYTKAVASGLCELDASAKVPVARLPDWDLGTL